MTAKKQYCECPTCDNASEEGCTNEGTISILGGSVLVGKIWMCPDCAGCVAATRGLSTEDDEVKDIKFGDAVADRRGGIGDAFDRYAEAVIHEEGAVQVEEQEREYCARCKKSLTDKDYTPAGNRFVCGENILLCKECGHENEEAPFNSTAIWWMEGKE